MLQSLLHDDQEGRDKPVTNYFPLLYYCYAPLGAFIKRANAYSL